jgi:hypothetical protein
MADPPPDFMVKSGFQVYQRLKNNKGQKSDPANHSDRLPKKLGKE